MTARRRWYERMFPGLYRHVLPATFTPAQTRQQAQRVRRLLRLRKGRRVLDIPCGMGRLTIPLARTGLVMTGVDLTDPYLRQARSVARAEGLDVRFVRADMRAIDFDGEFDAAFNWFGSFGYFSDRDNLAVLRRLHRALKPGGRVLIEGLNKPWVLSHLHRSAQEQIGPVQIAHRIHFDRRTSRLRDLWTLRKGRSVERIAVSIRLYSGADIRNLLRQAGFADIELFGGPAAGPVRRSSPRWIAVGRRIAECGLQRRQRATGLALALPRR
jgi:ubiquinone/menaquinone biosynthesis C-methylase UbiE